MKTATVQARIEPKLKKEVEAILAEIGLSASQAISMYYSSIKLHKGIPFEAKVPNKALRKAINDARRGKNVHEAKDAKDMINQILGKR
jgi:DNA-damage-inducible protein J